MVEPLKELNQICQKPRYREVGNWMVRHFLRDAALPVTWLLLHTSVTANQVTIISLIMGLVGIYFFAIPSAGFFLTGAILLELWYFLDHVDGQIARYRKTACLSGRFFDFITHHLIHGVIFFSLGLYALQVTGKLFCVLLGFTASVAMIFFNLTSDTKYKTFVEALIDSGRSIKIDKGASRPESKGALNLFQSIYSTLHKLSEIHVLMNLLTLFAFLEFVMKIKFDFRYGVLIFYGLAVPVLTLVKITYLISKRKIDEEFHFLFRPV